jgi:DNA-directed RNA polymerase subunit beta'
MSKTVKFKNSLFNKKELKNVIYTAFIDYGTARASYLADDLKELGFHYATKAGISISIEDLKVPPIKKSLLSEAYKEIETSDTQYHRGEINTIERFQNVINTWNNTSETLKDELVSYFKTTDPLNSIYLMAFSGARGNLSQVRQLVGMRGLMSDPQGQIIDIPIIHNFREGLTITDYIMSAYGARKGVVDTALRTADSGYLTRRLIDVAQDVIIREEDCLTKRSINLYPKNFKKSDFIEKISGRISASNVFYPNTKKILVKKNQEIDIEIANRLYDENLHVLGIRSPLTCESTRSICQKCYGWNLSGGKVVDLGEAVGIIAAQSIGEPGTQLTMRTFHTGGIFTADPSRQIRSQKSGIVSFSKNIQTRPARTMYGKNILLLEKETFLTFTDYKNQSSEIKLSADSSIFVKDNDFVKEKELLAELPLTNQQTTQAKKDILSPVSGEIVLTNQEDIVWVLNGNIYDIPKDSLLNEFKANDEITEQDGLINFKIKSKNEGIVKLEKHKINNTLESLKILNCLQYFKMPLYKDKSTSKLILINNKGEKYLIEDLPKAFKSKSILFAQGTSNVYRAPSGGDIYYKSSSFYKGTSTKKEKVIQKSGKLLFIPKEVKAINKNAALLEVLNGSVIEEKTELLKGTVSNLDGFVETKESNNIIQQITIRPGKFVEYLYLKEEEKKQLLELNKKIFFPGEIIFEDVIVEYLSYVEITKVFNRYGLLLRPIYEFNIPKPKVNKNSIVSNKNTFSPKLNFSNFDSLNFNSGDLVKQHKNRNIINSSISLNWDKTKLDTKTGLQFKILKNKKQTNLFNLVIITNEIINLINFLPKKFASEKLKISLHVKESQFIEPQTILGKISLLPEQQFSITKIKKTVDPSARLMLVNKRNYETYYSEKNNFLVTKDDMIKAGNNITPSLKINYSGQILKVSPFACKLHRGIPFFLTKETVLYKTKNDLVKVGDTIGTIIFEQAVTGDIVQGLPKVEEILEARKPQDSALLANSPGIVIDVKDNNTINILGNANYLDDSNLKKSKYQTYQINRKKTKQNIIVNKNDYLYVGQPLTAGIVSPHNLLTTYFEYYKTINLESEAAYLSFRKIQKLLINKVQDVYGSQGVTIADKHIEVIIRQITSKVEVTTAGSTLLLPGEVVELRQINYINSIMQKTGKKQANYKPMLLGITKASLLTESFISAASFQETTKILTAAAIEGKIDWLRGLKENVIIGRLIPAGTGFDDKPQIKMSFSEIT